MLLEEFNKKYNLDNSHIHVRIGEGSFRKEDVLYKNSRERTSIREEFFLRRIEFRKKVKNYIQDMYFLLERVSNDSELARIFGVANTYFSQGLWNSYEHHSILNYKINGSDWKLFRKMRKLHRRIEQLGVKFDIKEILDMEAKICQEKEEYSKLMCIIHQKETKNLLKTG